MEYCNNAILYCEMVVQLCLMWQSAVLQFWGLIPARIKPGIPNIEDHLLFKELNVKTVREQKIPLWLQEKNAKTSVCHVLHASKNFIFFIFFSKTNLFNIFKNNKIYILVRKCHDLENRCNSDDIPSHVLCKSFHILLHIEHTSLCRYVHT